MNDGIFPEHKRKIIGVIAALIPEAKIYLFGSRARGKFSESSDIDIALDTGEKIERGRIGEVKDLLNQLSVPYFFDVVDFYKANSDFKAEIEKDMVLWKN